MGVMGRRRTGSCSIQHVGPPVSDVARRSRGPAIVSSNSRARVILVNDAVKTRQTQEPAAGFLDTVAVLFVPAAVPRPLLTPSSTGTEPLASVRTGSVSRR